MAQNDQDKIAQLLPEQREAWADYTTKLERVKAAHPEFDEKALAGLEARRRYDLDRILGAKLENDKILKSASGKTPKEFAAFSAAQWKEFITSSDRKMLTDVISPHGSEGARANAIFDKELKPGITGGIVKNFWDENDKGPLGGLQIGGVLGALAGLFLGMNLGGMLGGGWMSIIAIIGGVLAGAWLGDTAGDGISSLFSSGDKTPQSAPGQGKSRQVDTDAQKRMEAARAAAAQPAERNEPPKDGERVNTKNLGKFTPPPVPTTPPATETEHER